MSDHDLFEAEESALRAAVHVHDLEGLDAAAYRQALGALIGEFRRLVRQTRRVILHSDRQERDLNMLNARLKELAAELDYKATHDPLTNAYNRRAVVERTGKYLEDGAVALIVLDIDHFKRINDEYGHPAGDAVIVELVTRVRAAAPTHAEIGRVGGEEFTVVLPGTGLDDALALAERMRADVAAVPFALATRRTVTASFGVSHTAQGRPFGDAYSRADSALYEAKRGGRNRVCSADA
ncbi:MAG TPA: GGDEF domain-containing protein [Rudaea sp.]|nr:GGDEF domain-containing protein [Rudaea sp.]